MATYRARGDRLDFNAANAEGAQGIARVTGLRDGGFGITWLAADNDRTVFDGDVFGQVYNADLTLALGATRLITDTGPSNSYPANQALTSLTGGGFALFSTDDARYSAADAASHQDVALRLYGANGASLGQPVYLGTSSVVGVTTTTLSDGRLVAGWIDTSGDLRGEYVSANGTPIGSSFVIANPASGIAELPSFAALETGGWVATYVAQSSLEAHAIFYNAQGVAGADTVIAQNLNTIQGVQTYGLEDGRVIAVWSQQPSGQGLETHGQIYSADGTKFGTELTISTTASTISSVTALADGGFAVALEPRSSDPLEVKIYDSTGRQNGSLSFDHAIEPSISALSDQGFVLAWKDSATGQFHAQAYSMIEPGVRGDLNGDGFADILWRNDDGSLTNWLGGADGGFTGNDAVGRISGISTSWKVAGFADLNGDGLSDILWRNDSGALTDWLGRSDGSYVANDSVALIYDIPTSWKVAGVADFNGDGHSDILWRNDSGALTDWLSKTDGSFVANDSVALIYDISTSWKVAGVGDFNGDGRDDILWRNDSGAMTNWLGQANGGFVANDSVALIYDISTSWKVAGVGDFNGDGRDDILWRNDSGALTDWLGQANGGFVANDSVALIYDIPTSWKVAGVQDFNGDGRGDILWRNDSGALTDWLGQANGGFAANDAVALTYEVSTSWHTQLQGFNVV